MLRLDQVCRDFEAAWHNGQPPEIEQFLCDIAPAQRPAFAQELVLLDMEYRRSGGCPCQLEDYLDPFPELDRCWLLNAWSGETITKAVGSSEASAKSNPGTKEGKDTSANGFAFSGMVAREYEI